MRTRAAARRPSLFRAGLGQRRHRPDYVLVILSIILLVLGLIVVYAVSPGLSAQKGVNENYYIGKQSLAVGIGLVTFLIASAVPLNSWRKLQKPLVLGAILAAAAVQLFGEEVNGAARWIQIGGLSFQAVELIKFALVVWLAGFLREKTRQQTLDNYQQTLKPLLIILAGISVIVAILQSDLGSSGVIVAIMGAMCFVAGLPLRRIAAFGGIILIGTILAIAASPYRRERFATFLNPERDCQNAGYQSCQALIAIGSGGMFGKGVGRSVQAYGYTPEAANDSIFAIYSEMFGFVGVTVLIGLMIGLFAKLKSIIERAPNLETRLMITGILAWLSTQALINIGAMIGLLPLKGITLPFISYGGTSIIFVMAAVGIAFNVSKYTTYGANVEEAEGTARYENSAYGRGNRRPHYAAVSRRP